MFSIKKQCTCCLSYNLNTFLDLGDVPLAGSFIKSKEETVLFPLSLSFCTDCSHIQVDQYLDKDLLFKEYRYASRYSMKSHFYGFAEIIKQKFGCDLKIMEIGSNDGTFLDFLSNNNTNLVGVEPSINISKIAVDNGHKIINNFFNKDVLLENKIPKHSFDIITASNCFAHIEDIDAILLGVNYALKNEGTFILEVHYGPNLFKTCQYDFIYHEHMYYYSLTSLEALLNRHNLSIYDVEFIPIHGGSIRAFIRKTGKSSITKTERLKEFFLREKHEGFNVLKTYIDFRDQIFKHIINTKNLLLEIKKSGKTIVGFGASGRANAFLNYSQIDSEIVDFIFDESPERAGRYIPKMNIPIVFFDTDTQLEVDYLFVTAWNFYTGIIEKCSIINYNYSIVAFPNLTITSKH